MNSMKWDKLKISLVALEDRLATTNNEIESLRNEKLDKQKLKELIAEETAELHDIIDDTCGKVSQLEADRSEGNGHFINYGSARF